MILTRMIAQDHFTDRADSNETLTVPGKYAVMTGRPAGWLRPPSLAIASDDSRLSLPCFAA